MSTVDIDKLEKMLFEFAKHVRLASMYANEKIRGFYQLDDTANVDVEGQIKAISNYIDRLFATQRTILKAELLAKIKEAAWTDGMETVAENEWKLTKSVRLDEITKIVEQS